MKPVACLAALAAVLPASSLAQTEKGSAQAAGASTVTITITDLRNTKGVIRACMTTNADIFPKCRKDPASHRTVVKAGESVKLRFEGVEPGRYAIALLHDENDNGKADRALLGMMPREGFGFSKDAPVRMGPPSFKDAAFDIAEDDAALTIRMRYML